jgi:hypothetical protein
VSLEQTGSPLEKAVAELEGHFAYDMGAVDSGVRDQARRAELAAQIDAASEDELRYALSRHIRNAFLSDEAMASGYGWEDALAFARWFDDLPTMSDLPLWRASTTPTIEEDES